VGRQIALETRKAEGVIANAAYPVFRLPKATTFDTKAGAHCVMYSISKQLPRSRSLDRRVILAIPEQQSELGTVRTEMGRRSDGEIDLKTALQQEDSKHGQTARQIEEMNCLKLPD
jgi:hypothetical protein